MEIGDENLPPSVNSVKTESLVYAAPRSPGTVRSVLVAVNTSVNEAKIISDLGSGTTEEEKCEAVAADLDAEAWSERTAVITRYDHETHCNLARGFIADLADKVVEESWKQPDQTKENSNSLLLKKQKLFLPDLVPSVATSRPLTETVSESDEYESADEQPQLHNTLYLDSTVNPSTTFDASTPIDTTGWHLDFDSSRVAPLGDVTVDASLKDYSLPSVDAAPESLSQVPQALQEETDALGAIANFPARSSQLFSPSSGSDIDVSVVDSEADTLAAVTPNNPTNEVDIDLINQFERLVLSKQVLSKHSPATPTLNTTFPLNEDENTPIVAVNQTVSSVNEEKDNSILPANATQDILSTTRDLTAVNLDDSEFTSIVDQSEHSSFADLKGPKKNNLVSDSDNLLPIAEKQKIQIIEGQEAAGYIGEEYPVVEEEIGTGPEEEAVSSDIEEAGSVVVETSVGVVAETVPAVEEESVSEEKSAAVVQKEPVSVTEKEPVLVVKENPAPVVKEEPVSVKQEEPVAVANEEPVLVVKEEPVLVVEEELVPVAQEEPVPVAKEEPIPVAKEEPIPVVEEEPVPVVEEEPVPVVEEEPIPVVEEEPVPVVEEEPVPVVEEEPVPVVEEEPIPVVEEEPIPVVEEEPVPVVEEEPVPVVEEEPVPVVEEEPVQVVEEEPVPVVEEEPVPVVEEEPVTVVEEEPVPATEKESVSVVREEFLSVGEEKSVPAEEETSIPETEKEIVPVIAEETVSVVSVLEQESFSATEGESIPVADLVQIVGNKTIQVHEEQNPNLVGEEQISIKETIVPAIESQPSSSFENSDAIEPVDVNNSEVDTGLVEGDSTFSSVAEQTVLNAADKSSSTVASDIPSEEIQPSSAVENSEFTSSQDPDTNVVKPTSLPEEKPIVPKKGYDLSFLDRFDDLENATPSISQAKLLTQLSTPVTDYSASPVTEQQSKTVPVNVVEDQEVEVVETIDTTSQVDIEKETCVPVNSQESQSTEVRAQEEPFLEDKAADVSVHTNPEREVTEEEPLIVPKKGYDLSFLDKLEDLENAAPPDVGKGSQKPKMKENVATKDNIADPAEEQPALDSKPEKPAVSSPTKKAPVVRKPIRPRIARPAAPATATKPDAFEVEFAFDPNEDPFKPKKKLGASPTREGSPQNQSEANICNTHQVDNSEANNTVIESIPQSASPNPNTASARLSSEGTEQEEFRPAQEVFHDPSELDFLMQHGGTSHDIALARQSLFVKFDPLVTGRPSMFPSRPSDGGDETILAEESTGRKSAGESLFLFSPPHASSAPKVEKVDSVEKSHPQECLMSSRNVTGDVLSLNEHKEALKLQELLFQDKLLQKEREILMKENEIHDFKSKFEATIEAQAQMRQIVGEYEKTISQLIAEKEREKANMETTLQNTIKERDQAIEDLKEVERAFSEFHRMYERNRTAAENLHKNEEALKKALAAYQERLQQEQHKYETLKLHAAQKLEGAQQEMENLKRNLEGESSRVKAQLKKTEMRLASVEQSLEQKSKENEELTTLCDELINKLGSNAK
ncbi:titin isoform X4 [Daphnia magna]|uniref:titin isoform X4 n=1 Tax=Daphnia magna TaxID=35525 RepID=UPI001E1BC0BB|nr:titin isoform X4 [Daphnia magna]